MQAKPFKLQPWRIVFAQDSGGKPRRFAALGKRTKTSIERIQRLLYIQVLTHLQKASCAYLDILESLSLTEADEGHKDYWAW